ncbi:MAG: LemA family protein [Clostridiales bacterium]|nr:LemA family protein [Clostridiales bacterium]
MGYVIAIVAVVVLIGIWVIGAYNGFVKMRNKVEEAFATMDVYLKKRYDLIPNLVETVKGYAKHESQTLENVIAARNMAAGAKTTDEKVAGENALQGTLKSLFAIAEAYPDLKANSNFISLQGQLTEMEGEIANSRKFYNAIVKTFNTKVEVFPSNIIAKLFKFTRKTMFEVEEAEQRQNVKVQF